MPWVWLCLAWVALSVPMALLVGAWLRKADTCCYCGFRISTEHYPSYSASGTPIHICPVQPSERERAA